MTKKKFRSMLNKKYGVSFNTHWHKRDVSLKREFGDYLYSSDRVYFDMLYFEFLKTGEY